MSPRVRVAVLLGREPLRRFEVATLEAIRSSPVATLDTVVRSAVPGVASARDPRWLARGFARMDSRIFGRPLDALGAAPTPGAETALTQRDPIDPASPAFAHLVENTDVLLCLAALPEAALAMLPRPRLGTWWPADASRSAGNASLPGEHETLAGSAVTRLGVTLARPGESPRQGPVAIFATDVRSPHRTRAAAAQRLPGLIADALRGAARAELARPGDVVDPSASSRTTQQPEAVAAGAARLARRLVRDRIDALRWREHWGLAYALDPADPFDPRAFRRIEAPQDGLYADPFPVPHGDGWLVFLEQVRPGEARGVLSVLSIDARGHATAPECVIETPTHLSYPFVFTWDGAWWMIPESAEARCVELWRAVEFPFRWQRERTLLHDVRAFDATLAEMDGCWRLFTSLEPRDSLGFDELHAFEASSPLAPFVPHPANPLLRDVRAARPAGRLERDARGWLRPAQDCSRRYGGATVLRRIERIDDSGLVEHTEHRIDPWADDVRATHTWNRAGRLVVVDAVFRQPR